MNIYEAQFDAMYPVGSTLIIAAPDLVTAWEIASDTVRHTNVTDVKQVTLDEAKVIVYLSGDY